MGLLTLFSKPAAALLKLPAGSFTVDREGSVLISTLPSIFPETLVNDIATNVLAAFRQAEPAQLTLAELVINYPSLRITARELRGGAVVFLFPKATYASGPN
jgi:hypothetical protein